MRRAAGAPRSAGNNAEALCISPLEKHFRLCDADLVLSPKEVFGIAPPSLILQTEERCLQSTHVCWGRSDRCRFGVWPLKQS